MPRIPEKLKNDAFRFVKLKQNGKTPIEKDWPNLQHSWRDAEQWNSNNYGIATGHAKLYVIDFDSQQAQDLIFPLLPRTFSVKSAGRGLLHLYYFDSSDNEPRTMRFSLDEKKLDIQGKGAQIVGPGSSVNQKTYDVQEDVPIAVMRQDFLVSVLADAGLELQQTKGIGAGRGKWRDTLVSRITGHDGPHRELILPSEVLEKLGIEVPQGGSDFNSACPLHASERGQCLHCSDDKRIWYCFHCLNGGGITRLVMLAKHFDFKQAVQWLDEQFRERLREKGINSLSSSTKISADDAINFSYKLWDSCPYFYDQTCTFYSWNISDKRYEHRNDTNMLILLADVNGINPLVKSSEISLVQYAMKNYGNRNIPEELGKEWIHFKNEVVNFKTGERLLSGPEFLVTNPIPWDVGLSEDTPNIDRLLEQWVGKDWTKVLQEIMAYCLLRDYPLHHAFVIMGFGKNGKSNFLELLRRLVGEDNSCTSELEGMSSNRFAAASLWHKLVCEISEASNDMMKGTGLFKQLTGGDMISFEHKGKQPFFGKNYAKLIINTNVLPLTQDTSYGFARRWIIINFPNRFETGPSPAAQIQDWEIQNFCLKSLRLLKNVVERGKFSLPDHSEEAARRSYESASNPVSEFIYECCETGTGLKEPFMSFARAYSQWAHCQHKNFVGQSSISKYVKAAQKGRFGVRRETAGLRRHVVDGLCVKNEYSVPHAEDTDSQEMRDEEIGR